MRTTKAKVVVKSVMGKLVHVAGLQEFGMVVFWHPDSSPMPGQVYEIEREGVDVRTAALTGDHFLSLTPESVPGPRLNFFHPAMDKPANVPTALWDKFGPTAEYINDKVTSLRDVVRCQDLGKYVVVEFPQSEAFNLPARIYWALVPRRERTK